MIEIIGIVGVLALALIVDHLHMVIKQLKRIADALEKPR